MVYIFKEGLKHTNKGICDKNVHILYDCMKEVGFVGSTQVESPICGARSQICTQYMLGVRFVRACHLALLETFSDGFLDLKKK